MTNANIYRGIFAKYKLVINVHLSRLFNNSKVLNNMQKTNSGILVNIAK